VPHRDELTLEEAIRGLEGELGRPESEKRLVGEGGEEGVDTSVSATPLLSGPGGQGALDLDNLDFSGPAHVEKGPVYATEPAEVPLVDVAAGAGSSPGSGVGSEYSESDDAEASSGSAAATPDVSGEVVDGAVVGGKGKKYRFRRKGKGKGKSGDQGKEKKDEVSEESVERVINVKNCPLCHRPRMNDKAEMDIVTHMAVCASQDWEKVDRIVVGNFVTANQAQRKWYTKIIGKVSSGDYRLGAVCFLSNFITYLD
jgi:phosphatidylserine decarboxylase